MSSRSDWWKDFFSGLVVDFWRGAMPPEATSAEADFFERHLRVSPGACLLDIPCGDGRLCLELARRSYEMTGVDISEEFLEAARQAARREGLAIEWRLSDMRKLPWKDRFDGAFCAGSSFGFLGDEGDAMFLATVSRGLKPGAYFAIDALKTAEVIFPHFRERHEMEVGGIHFLAENRYEGESGWTENRYTITRGQQSETRVAWHRIYTHREVARMLDQAGFEQREHFGSLEGEPFRLGSSRSVLVVRKRGENESPL